MKAPLDLPDELYHQIESLAAHRGETVTALVANALSTFVGSVRPADVKMGHVPKKQRKKRPPLVPDPDNPGYMMVPEDPAVAALSPEERLKKWQEEEAAFMKLMKGPDLDPRSAAEIIKEGRR